MYSFKVLKPGNPVLRVINMTGIFTSHNITTCYIYNAVP